MDGLLRHNTYLSSSSIARSEDDARQHSSSVENYVRRGPYYNLSGLPIVYIHGDILSFPLVVMAGDMHDDRQSKQSVARVASRNLRGVRPVTLTIHGLLAHLTPL